MSSRLPEGWSNFTNFGPICRLNFEVSAHLNDAIYNHPLNTTKETRRLSIGIVCGKALLDPRFSGSIHHNIRQQKHEAMLGNVGLPTDSHSELNESERYCYTERVLNNADVHYSELSSDEKIYRMKAERERWCLGRWNEHHGPHRKGDMEQILGGRLVSVMNLCATKRYYDGNNLTNVDYRYTPMEGGGIMPDLEKTTSMVLRFQELCVKYGKDVDDTESPMPFIYIHCTHGINRTGFLITSILRALFHKTRSESLEAFARMRNHLMYKEEFVDAYDNLEPAIRSRFQKLAACQYVMSPIQDASINSVSIDDMPAGLHYYTYSASPELVDPLAAPLSRAQRQKGIVGDPVSLDTRPSTVDAVQPRTREENAIRNGAGKISVQMVEPELITKGHN